MKSKLTGWSRPHRAAFQASETRLIRSNGHLVIADRRLKQEIARRKSVEEALKKSEQHHRRLLDQSHIMREQLRQLTHQLLLAQEEERKEISRELHDQVAQTLTGINVHLATLKREAKVNTKGLTKKITYTQRLVARSVNIVHRFARELRPTVLDDLGLIPALRSYMRDFSKRTGIHLHFVAFAGIERLDISKRTTLYRVAQEALTNVAKHAHASKLSLCIQKLKRAIRMEIKDNGRGFAVERMLFTKKGNRLGLLGMRERVEMIGGGFNVISAPGKGTAIRVEIPLGKSVKI